MLDSDAPWDTEIVAKHELHERLQKSRIERSPLDEPTVETTVVHRLDPMFVGDVVEDAGNDVCHVDLVGHRLDLGPKDLVRGRSETKFNVIHFG